MPRPSPTLSSPAAVSRFLAGGIDLMVIIAIFNVVDFLRSSEIPASATLAALSPIILLFGIAVLYGIALEGLWSGQTLGKRMLGLRVADAGGGRPRFHQIVIRNVLRPLDMLPAVYMIGGIACAVSHRAQRLGDLAAATVVTSAETSAPPDLTQLPPLTSNPLCQDPSLIALLRQHIPAAEANIAARALVRSNDLDATARDALFAALSTRFRDALPRTSAYADGPAEPPLVVRGASSLTQPKAPQEGENERFVRNVIDVLFHPAAPR